jgi:hypothetical protein
MICDVLLNVTSSYEFALFGIPDRCCSKNEINQDKNVKKEDL